MNRRHFLASAAATAIAPSIPAQPARDFWGTGAMANPAFLSAQARRTRALAYAMRHTKEIVAANIMGRQA